MASNGTSGNGNQLLVVGETGGVTLIDPSTPLKRLNYFDGKFLRAGDFDLEQRYLRELVALSNQGLGAGVVYGFDTVLASGDTIQVGPGLAIDPSGRVLLMQASATQSIQALIDASRKIPQPPPQAGGNAGPGDFSDCIEVAAPPPTTVVPISDIYVIAICSAEALCGQADVYGRLCEEACVTSTDRPYRLDGIVLRAIPLQLVTPFPTSKAVAIDSDLYLRSKVAHSYFADEVLKHPAAISRAGLLSHVWCLGAGYDSSCCEVPLAIVARSGARTIFLDAWTVRRERMDAPARRYWQWKMMMRPWNVFLAQILQFQCQLAELFEGIVTPGRTPDPCADERQALHEARTLIEELRSGLANFRTSAPAATLSTAERPALLSLSLTRVSDLQEKISNVLQGAGAFTQPRDRILIRGGIIELPSAGYLPVMNGTNVSVNAQVRALLGEGLDLRFCVARADYIAHEVEKAQHMERISLLQGLDDPSNKPRVDIIVPDGEIAEGAAADTGLYDAVVTYSAQQTGGLAYRGAGREESLDAGGSALYVAGAGVSQSAAVRFADIAAALGRRDVGAETVTITPNLSANEFVASTAANTVNLAARVSRAATTARSFMMRAPTLAAETPGAAAEVPSAAAPAAESADGFWLTSRTEKRIQSLSSGSQTPVSARLLIGSHPAAPVAYEMMFNGRLAIDSVSAGATTLTGSLNGLMTLGAFKADQAKHQETEILFISHVNFNAKLVYTGTDQNGAVTLTLQSPGSNVSYMVEKTYAGAAHITYTLSLVGAAGAGPAPLAKLDLLSDPGVVDPSNPNHILAQNGLDIVQAALIESEPGFEKQASGELFPAGGPAVKEIAIRAVRDWVMFTRRREERCALDVAPIPVAPPRSYQVVNIRARSAEDAQRYVEDLSANLTDPVALGNWLRELLRAEIYRTRLIVRFRGNSAIALSDLTAAESDWRQMSPGDTIHLAAAGARDETDGVLQIARIKTFEGAIAADSHEDPHAREISIVPFPENAVPPAADGIMLFVTSSSIERVHAYATNADVFKNVVTAANEGKLTPDLVGRLTDLGIATASGSGAAQVVTDTNVVNAFNAAFANSGVTASILLSRSGDSAEAFDNRTAAAVKMVSHLDATAPTPVRMTYPPANAPGAGFPITDANAILVVRVIRRRQG